MTDVGTFRIDFAIENTGASWSMAHGSERARQYRRKVVIGAVRLTHKPAPAEKPAADKPPFESAGAPSLAMHFKGK